MEVGQPPGSLIHHTDRGGQYASARYRGLEARNVRVQNTGKCGNQKFTKRGGLRRVQQASTIRAKAIQLLLVGPFFPLPFPLFPAWPLVMPPALPRGRWAFGS